MFRLRSSLLLTGLLLASLATATAAPFTARLQQGQTLRDLTDGSGVTLAADALRLPATATLTITYVGSNPQSPTSMQFNTLDLTGLTGLADFAVDGMPSLPANLGPNQSITVTLRYTPSASVRASAKVAFGYTENMGPQNATFSLNLVGLAPEFAFSYVSLPAGNATVVAPGGTVLFPQTSTSGSSSATFVLSNRGSGPGTVNAISLSGADYQLSGVPLAGTNVDAGRDLRFTVTFTPKQLQTSKGVVSLDLASGRASFNLEGTGYGPVFAYEAGLDTSFSPVIPNQVITLPDTAVGEKSNLVVRVKNNGNADGVISVINLLGGGFQLSEVPFLPLTLPPGGAAAFTVNFSPTLAGRASGRLRIGNDNFELTAGGLGATLAYSYVVGGVTQTLQPNGTVNFMPVAVGRTASLKFQVSNSGSAAGTLTSVSILGTSTVFTLSGLPKLPAQTAPGATLSFTVEFTPLAAGAATATLKLDGQSFTLSAAANPPEALPSYKFEAPAGPQDALQQPAIGLTLNSAYPLALTGMLTLAFNSEVGANDPAVQFATGGRSVTFTIPANATKAVFANNQTQIKLQTGTVAGAITLSPTFSTAGGVDLTPQLPPALTLNVPQAAPRLLGVEVSQKTSNSFTLLVKGYTTALALTQLDFQFTAANGENVATTKLSVNVESSFMAWIRSTQAAQYGSLFTVTVPFTLQGNIKSVASLVDTIQSVSVTATNRMGTSSAQSVSLQ